MSLAKHLAAQKTILQSFVALLEEEMQVLSRRDVDGAALKRVADRKQLMLASLDQMESQRASGLQKLGYPSGHEGTRKAAEDARCTTIWSEILDLAFRAKHLNEVNGSLLRMRTEQNQRMLDFLRESAGGELYGPDGQTRGSRFKGLNTQA